jgi:excinuclease UvrABC helicase subunit UvrB
MRWNILFHDYYQPEAFMLREFLLRRTLSINEELEKMRMSTASLLSVEEIF